MKLKITPSKFAETFLNLTRNVPFSFQGREYFKPIYDSNENIELFKTARQCAKSTYLGNRIITRACSQSLQILYEAPKIKQSITFSRQKLDPILTHSERLKPFLLLDSNGNVDKKNVLNYYCFKTGSYVTLSTTYNGPDRDRGISINDLYVDEVQDQLLDNINILKEGLSASTTKAYICYAGTPKSKANDIERLWEDSRQIVWMMKCEGCGIWQLPTMEDNVRESGLLCKKCEKRLNVLNGEWVVSNRNGTFNGWHITQLMRLVKGMPGGLSWTSIDGMGIWDRYKIYTPETFNNEVLGFSSDSAENPLTFDDMKNVAIDTMPLQTKYDPTFMSRPIVMGIDWGNNKKSFTVVSIYIEFYGKPTLIFMKKFDGVEADPAIQAKLIKEIFVKFKCNMVYCDNGMFWNFEKSIRDEFGNDFVNKKFNFVYYWQNEEKLITRTRRQDKILLKISRNEMMNLYIGAIKQIKTKIFNFNNFVENNFHTDYLAVCYETRQSKDRGERLFFMSSRDTSHPTDAFHSGLYGWFGMMMELSSFKWYYDDDQKKPDRYY